MREGEAETEGQRKSCTSLSLSLSLSRHRNNSQGNSTDCIGIPLGIYLFLRHNRHRLHEEEFVKQYGFIFEGYKNEEAGNPALYWWECLVMIRKLAIVATGSFALDGYIQSLIRSV